MAKKVDRERRKQVKAWKQDRKKKRDAKRRLQRNY